MLVRIGESPPPPPYWVWVQNGFVKLRDIFPDYFLSDVQTRKKKKTFGDATRVVSSDFNHFLSSRDEDHECISDWNQAKRELSCRGCRWEGKGGGVLKVWAGSAGSGLLNYPYHISGKWIVQTRNDVFSRLVADVRHCLPHSKMSPFRLLAPSHWNTISQTCW